ncbi:beta-ketoacyl synthase N-terminal-like domain-containing protein [Streptomyces geysiriensis]|uniref:beta-ketoacyl synthase N-terminal-like domain-containing protein n=1 Tax=Streptomyces rochei group TaxID=2867164 RepID=UPI001C7DF8C8|nr:beta-ketoacyl synthase N-terminal-like domain-containing protein [Streptomyces geysiriensis]MBX4179630.1 ketosynthase chain-length factor [Streptomyces geysiriensis]
MTKATQAPEPARPTPAGAEGPRQTLVTGIGVAAPNGLGTRAWWDAVLCGRTGLGPITRFDASGYPVRIAGEIPGFVDEDHIPSRLLPSTDRGTRIALVAAEEALRDANVSPADLPAYGAGVITASSAGGAEFGERGLAALWSKGAQHVSAYQSFASFHAAAPAQISIRHRLRGHGSTVVSEQAGGIDALARARRRIRDGACLMVTGGIDSTLCAWGWAAHLADGRLSPATEPARAYRPFAATADGHAVGEGGALLVLEDARAAARRGATGYGVIAGCAATFDGPDRPTLRQAAELALADAGLAPEHVDVVFADGAAERRADLVESQALCALFGPYGVPVTVPKTMTGRLGAGGSALDVAAALLALREKVVPPTTGTGRVADDCPLDLVTGAPRELPRLRVALILARGRGGFNSAAVLRAPQTQ